MDNLCNYVVVITLTKIQAQLSGVGCDNTPLLQFDRDDQNADEITR